MRRYSSAFLLMHSKLTWARASKGGNRKQERRKIKVINRLFLIRSYDKAHERCGVINQQKGYRVLVQIEKKLFAFDFCQLLDNSTNYVLIGDFALENQFLWVRVERCEWQQTKRILFVWTVEDMNWVNVDRSAMSSYMNIP